MQEIHEEQINRSYIIEEGLTSIYVFILPIFVLIVCILYLLNYQNGEINYIVLFISMPIFITSTLSYLNKKIILTKSSLYYFVNKKSTFSVKLNSEFKLLDISQSAIGKILNYGTLYIFDNDGKFIEYKFFKDPLNFRKKFVKAYVYEMKKIDPSFQIEDIDIDEKDIKSIDRIE